VERLAELRPLDLVLESVEVHEIQAVAQRRAADRRTDRDPDIRLGVTIDVDIDIAGARFRFFRDDHPVDAGDEGPGRIALSGLVAVFLAGLIGIGEGRRQYLWQWSGALFKIGHNLGLP